MVGSNWCRSVGWIPAQGAEGYSWRPGFQRGGAGCLSPKCWECVPSLPQRHWQGNNDRSEPYVGVRWVGSEPNTFTAQELKPEKIIIQNQACDHGNRQRCSQKETSYSSRPCQYFYHQGLTEPPQRTTKMSLLTKSYQPLGEINIMQSCDTQKPNLPHPWGRCNICSSGNGGLLYMCIVQLLDN